MQNHLDNECTKYEIACPFSDCQCTFKALRSDMPKHLKESPGLHLNLMCKTIQIQKKQMQLLGEIVEKQKEQLVLLSTKVDSLEKFYGSQLIWKIDNFAVCIDPLFIQQTLLNLLNYCRRSSMTRRRARKRRYSRRRS